jgi:hypothetical protein
MGVWGAVRILHKTSLLTKIIETVENYINSWPISFPSFLKDFTNAEYLIIKSYITPKSIMTIANNFV